MRRHERPGPVEPLAVQANGQAAVTLLLDELVRAVVPDLDRAGAVLALRDLAFEGRVVERVILDVDRERPLAGLERHALWHGPARERAFALEPEVVMEPPRVVALNDEDRRFRSPFPTAERLARLLRIPLAAVVRQAPARHGSTLPVIACRAG